MPTGNRWYVIYDSIAPTVEDWNTEHKRDDSNRVFIPESMRRAITDAIVAALADEDAETARRELDALAGRDGHPHPSGSSSGL